MDGSYNGITIGLHPIYRGSIPLPSTKFMSDDPVRHKQFYSIDGDFALVDICAEDKQRSDALVKVLRKLLIHKGIDKDKLMSRWKLYDRSNVRKFLNR